ncbi:PepSY-associated transmembrane protein [Fluviicoccus keumensis]|uniref:PepSY-associated transmembrane protein n=2 Tax=Fluviicoccus keumensis TaxID=1435465 RepID=A0A4Q7Z5M1_9GAMM|nr:PepSY-associated transmembrane protein [Fluviicoccus keumensis]
MPMSRRFHWRFFLLRWHRRIGVVLGLYLFWMVGTGVLLHHAADLGLDRQMLESPFWLARYGMSPPHHFRVGAKEFVLGGQGLATGTTPLGDCRTLLGVASVADSRVLACDNRILLLTPTGELVDQTDSGRGLPGPFSAMATKGNQVWLRQVGSGAVLALDPMDFSLRPATETLPASAWLSPIAAPAAPSDERLLQDLHSGRLLGKFGPWLVDLLALAVLVLAVSGWVLAKKRHHKV